MKSKLIMLLEQFLQRQITAEQIGQEFTNVWLSYNAMRYLTGHQWEERNLAWMQKMHDKGLVLDELLPVQWPMFWDGIPNDTFNQMVSDIDTICGAYHRVKGFKQGFDKEAFYDKILALVNPPAELLMTPNMDLDESMSYARREPVFA